MASEEQRPIGKLERFFMGTQPSPLAILSGRDRYAEHLRVGQRRWLIWALCGGLLAVALPGVEIPGYQVEALLVILGLGGGTAFFTLSKLVRPNVPLYAVLVGFLCPVLSVLIWQAGPHLELATAVIPTICAGLFGFYPRRTAIIHTTLIMGSYGVFLATADGYPRPVQRWILMLGFVIASGALFDYLVGFVGDAVSRERAAHAELELVHDQLAEASRGLAVRVDEQVEEIERLGRLRRFLSPQVAETVLSTGSDDLLATHRRQIAVIFVDLRGFTAFSSVAEPEDVIEVLTEFHEILGKAVTELDATVGGFAGDGVMAYFNDPFPCDDPAGRALAMAQSLRDPMRGLRSRWRARGFNIGFGAGIAYGYATLGTIGFETRSEYTPLGSVVNLASRLCDEAHDGEVLLDARAYEAVRDRVTGDETELTLKGFSGPVTAHRVVIDEASRA